MIKNRYKLDEIIWPKTPFILEDHLFLAAKRGSESHNTYVPSTDPNSVDDRDIMAICIPPESYYLGLEIWEHSEEINGCWDVVVYEYRKFIRLLCKQNPNVLGMLWLRPEDYIYQSSFFNLLVANRHIFMSKTGVYNSFVGYAKGQEHKMMNNACQGYMGDKRKKLVSKFGYDTKNAAHVIRLLHMGQEFLETGKLNVWRTWDRDMLVDIKTGGWALEEVKKYINDCFLRTKELYEKSDVPDTVDLELVNDIVVKTISRTLEHNRFFGKQLFQHTQEDE